MPLFPSAYKKYCDRKLKVVTSYLQKDDKILDAGCGDKKHPYCFLELLKSYNIVGVDADNSWHPRILKGDIAKLNFIDQSFDAVVCLDVLEHIEDWEKAFEELIRVAKKTIIISVPVTESKVFFRINQLLRKLVGVDNPVFAGHRRDYLPENILKIAENKGFSTDLIKIKFAIPFFSSVLFGTKLRYGGIFIINK